LSLLDHNLSINYSIFVNIRQVDLKKHYGSAVGMSFQKFLPQFLLKLIPDISPIRPVLRGFIVTSLLQNQVSGYLSKKRFVIETSKLVQLRDLLLNQLVLESNMQLEL